MPRHSRHLAGRKTALALIAALLAALTLAAPASAQSHQSMNNRCANAAKTYYGEPRAQTDMMYNGTRVDGTHAVNGTIWLEARAADFACSFNTGGNRMISFFADGRERAIPIPPGQQPQHTLRQGDIARVHGVPANDVLNIRAQPDPNARIIGALANGDRVEIAFCRIEDSGRWCRIRLQDDMGGEGWVNSRFLVPN